MVIERLLDSATDAPYGDLNKMTTVVDREVKAARDVNREHFEIDPKICELIVIAETWAEKFYPQKVRVEPYKINIYVKGGHFKEHRDTPSKNLVGTFLLGIADTFGSYLEVKTHDSYYDSHIKWELSTLGSWCAFYKDMPH